MGYRGPEDKWNRPAHDRNKKTINFDDLIIGDKNAIIVAARKSAYGAEYETKVTCPSCGKVQQHLFPIFE